MKNLLLVLLLVAILILAFLLYKCHRNCGSKLQDGIACNHVPVDISRVIFWKKPNVSKSDFKKDINGWFQNTNVTHIEYCDNCDSSLIVASGSDVALLISGQTSHGSPPSSNNGVAGEDAEAYYSVDFPMEFNDSIYSVLDSIPPIINDSTRSTIIDALRNGRNAISPLTKPKINPHNAAPATHDTVTVAVFDTGVDSTVITDQLYKNNFASCLGDGANNGWNFPAHISNWFDDHKGKHGTVVSNIIVDQEYQSPNTYIKILPVKVHTSNGIGHLSDVLCALQYAKNRGAQIINASFGFYAPHSYSVKDTANSGAILFKNFLQNYFDHSNIIMIAAAGNMDDKLETYVYNNSNKVARRDLNNVSFYPASFAEYTPNVFAVTTVSESLNKVSPLQNFSSRVVDIGVNADTFFADTFVFVHPFQMGYVTGSSFATPIVTGKIAAHYQSIKNVFSTAGINIKDAIINKLQSNGLLHTASNNYFTNKIKGKKIMNK